MNQMLELNSFPHTSSHSVKLHIKYLNKIPYFV